MSKEDKFDEIVSAINKEFDNFIFLVDDMGSVNGDWINISGMLIQCCLDNDNFRSIVKQIGDFLQSEKFEEILEKIRMNSNKYND